MVLTMWTCSASAFVSQSLNKNAKLNIWFSTYKQECAELRKIAAEFTKETGIKVNVAESVVLNLRIRIPTAAKSSARPDVILLQSADIGVLKDFLKPVEWMDTATKNRFYPIAIDGMKYENKLYGVGYSTDAYGIVYNKKLISAVPKTWSEYFTTAENMNKKDASGNYTLQGTIINPSNFWFMYPVIKNYGGYYLGKKPNGSYNLNDIGLNNAGAVKAAKKLLELKKKGLTTMAYSEIETNISTKFAQGKIAMMVYGLWQANDYTKGGIDYGYAPLPKNDDGTVSKPLSTIQGFVVNKFSKWPKEAEAFVKFITQDKYQQRLYEAANLGNSKTGQRNTCNKAVYNSKYVQSSSLLKSLADVSLTGEIFPANPEASVIYNNTTRDAYDAIFYNGKDVKATLDALVATVKKDIANMQN
jgi:Maltose-binding periplasmic proteins/domains